MLSAIGAGAIPVLLVNRKKYAFENIAIYRIDNLSQVLDIIRE
jgi:hypothetical protein